MDFFSVVIVGVSAITIAAAIAYWILHGHPPAW